MAGHSKWAKIQHRKNAQNAQNAKRGKIFTKLIREITVASRMGGPDAASNPRLRAVVDKAMGGKVLAMIDMLQDLDDVQHVYTNAEFADQVAV